VQYLHECARPVPFVPHDLGWGDYNVMLHDSCMHCLLFCCVSVANYYFHRGMVGRVGAQPSFKLRLYPAPETQPIRLRPAVAMSFVEFYLRGSLHVACSGCVGGRLLLPRLCAVPGVHGTVVLSSGFVAAWRTFLATVEELRCIELSGMLAPRVTMRLCVGAILSLVFCRAVPRVPVCVWLMQFGHARWYSPSCRRAN
jgi:hypothetical protein